MAKNEGLQRESALARVKSVVKGATCVVGIHSWSANRKTGFGLGYRACTSCPVVELLGHRWRPVR